MAEQFQRIMFIGFRACGKSNLARRIAERIGWKLYVLDALLEEQFNQPIAQFVEQYGWQEFRRAELLLAQSLRHATQCIFDCGGGIVEQEQAVEPLAEHSFVVHVTADIETIIERLERKHDRPLLSASTLRDDVVTNFTRRKPMYERYAHATIDTTMQTKISSSEEVIEHLRHSAFNSFSF
jgi:shikimate kinase